MRWIGVGVLLLGIGCYAEAPTPEPVSEPGVRYSRDEVDGARVEVSLQWDSRRGEVGTGTKRSMYSTSYDAISEERFAELRRLFTPELVTTYEADAIASRRPVGSGLPVNSAPASWVSVILEELSPARVFVFHGSPSEQTTAHMLATLDDFARSVAAEK